jgi:hypothetical protein
MISLEASALAISVAKGVIKLAGRADRLMAEKEAVTGNLVIPLPPESGAPDVEIALVTLRECLTRTQGEVPDPLGTDRPRLQALLAQDPVPDDWIEFFERLFPEQAHPPAISPDAEYLKALRKWVPTVNWDIGCNAELCKAAFYIAAGRDQRGLGYGARLGLLVADTIAEFGAEHTALFIRDKNTQTIVQSVLQHFSKPDLEHFEDWSPFLHHTLSATLNGLLDSRAVFDGHSRWTDALLIALARARDQSEDGDNYLLGLLRGHGYSLLIGEGLQLAGESLTTQHADVFRDLVADLLIQTAPLVKANQHDFATFFKLHWADLLRGGLLTVNDFGPRLLEGQSPLLRHTLLAVTRQLAATPNTAFFTTDTALGLVEAAIGAVARDPDLLKSTVGEPRFNLLIASLARTINDTGLRATFSHDGLERLFKETLATFALHPELLVANPGLAQDIVANVLKTIANSKGMESWPLANAAVSGALHALAQHPELAGTKLGPHLAELSGQLATAVAAKGLNALQAADLVSAATEAILRNPQFLAATEQNVASKVLQAVLKAGKAPDDATSQVHLLAGATLVEVTRLVLGVVARHGAAFLDNHNLKRLSDGITATLSAGLERAAIEIGRRMDRSALPLVLTTLVGKFLKGELDDLNPQSDDFITLFNDIADASLAA